MFLEKTVDAQKNRLCKKIRNYVRIKTKRKCRTSMMCYCVGSSLWAMQSSTLEVAVQILNDMNSYGCDGQSGLPPGVDRQVVMCTHTFFECDWVNDTVLTHTGSNPEDYTTSVMGNASVAWIKSVLDKGKTHPPFFAWIGPHAPHLPSTPAPWYLDHPIGNLKAPTADPPYVDHETTNPTGIIIDCLNMGGALMGLPRTSLRTESFFEVGSPSPSI